ncbi:MAG: sulfotransferase [Xanthomonadales bacterium]|nr:sulfotransferase [Xanthomonadales bacterium]
MPDKNLIFLISLPRSGSTLTQKILGASSDIYTRSEPWLMLAPLYALKKTDCIAEYSKPLEYIATQDFISHLPGGGRKKYIEHIRNAYTSIYSEYSSAHGKRFFLDKTPRYYLIANELKEVFPNAKIIILLRNPLGVLSSIIKTWANKDLTRLANFKIDLVTGLDILSKLVAMKKNDFFFLRYEDILSDPANTFQEVFNYLGVKFNQNILTDYNSSDDEKWPYGDPHKVYKRKTIDTGNAMRWVDNLDDPQHWRLLYDYLNYVGKKRFELLGYDFESASKTLLSNMPCSCIQELEDNTSSLYKFLGIPTDEIGKEIVDQQS